MHKLIPKLKIVLVVVVLLTMVYFILSYLDRMTGTVVDAETGKPIEGAVVLVEWTITSGKWSGFRTTRIHAIHEAVTDQDGKFIISGVVNPFINPPTMIIYKKDYMAWRNDYLFPSFERREGFQWDSNYAIRGFTFRIEPSKQVFLHSKHVNFIGSGGIDLSGTRLEKAIMWEDLLARNEWQLFREKNKSRKQGETEAQAWQEIVRELYSQKGEYK